MADQVTVDLIINADAATAAIDNLANRAKQLNKPIKIPVEFDTSSAGRFIQSVDLAASKLSRISQIEESNIEAARKKASGYQQILGKLQEVNTLESRALLLLRQQNNLNAQGYRLLQQKQLALRNNSNAIKTITAEYQRLVGKIEQTKRLTEQYKNAINAVNNSVRQDSGGGFFDNLITKLTIGGIAVEAFKFALQGIGDFIRRGANLQQLTLGLEGFTGSADEANKAYSALKETAIRTPFNVADTVQANKVLLAFGVSVDDAVEATDDLAIIAGATGSDLNNLARNLGQISAQSRAYTRDLNQFAIAGIPIYKQLGEQLGVSQEQVREFAKDGSIGFEEVNTALKTLTATGSGFSELASRQVETVTGRFQDLQSTIDEVAKDFLDTFGPLIIGGINNLNSTLNSLKGNLDDVAIVLGTIAGAALTATLLPAIRATISGLALLRTAYAATGISAKTFFVLVTAGDFGKLFLGFQGYIAALKALGTQFLVTVGKAIALSGVVAGLAALFIVAKNSADAYKPSDALVEDEKAASRLNTELNKLAIKYGDVAKAAESTTAITENIGRAADLANTKTSGFLDAIFGAIPRWREYNLGLRQAESNIIGFTRATDAQGDATLNVIKAIKEYTNSNRATNEGLKEYTALAAARKNALEQENTSFQGQIQYLQQQLGANKELDNLIKLQISSYQTRINQNNTFIGVLAKLIPQITNLVSKERALADFYADPTLKNRTQVQEEYTAALEATTKGVNALIGAQKTLAEAPVRQLQTQLTFVSAEYDKQLKLLEQQKGRYQGILNQINAVIALEQLRAQGKSGFGEILNLQKQINAQQQQESRLRLAGLKVGSLDYNQELLSLRNLENQGVALGIQAQRSGEIYDATLKQAEVDSQIADAQVDKEKATRDITTALIEQQSTLDLILANLGLQEGALKNIEAAAIVAGSKMDENINGSINEGITKARELQGVLSNIASKPLTIEIKSTGQGDFDFSGAANNLLNKASGGPVSGGTKYTVNELGKEAFLSASGRLSMIDAPAWGTWKAPSSGTVIPAHLTKQLKIPAGGINLNSPRTANISASRLQRTGGNAAVSQAMHRISQAQQAQASELGRLSRAVDRMTDKNWNVDVNINGNNPLLNKLRRTR